MRLLSFISILIIGVYSNLLQECQLEKFTLTDKEEKIMLHYEEIIQQGVKFPYECLELLLQRGLHKAALTLYESYFLLNNIDIASKLSTFLKNDPSVANLDSVQGMFKQAIQSSNRIFTVEPVHQWAQSKNHTLIQVKFSHRVDSPACINAKEEEFTLTNTSVLQIDKQFTLIFLVKICSSWCGVSSIDQIFIGHKLQPSNCTRIELLKKRGCRNTVLQSNKSQIRQVLIDPLFSGIDLWLKLKEGDEKTPIWWDLRDNIGQDMEDYVQLLEKESEKREKKAEKSYRKKQKQKEKERERQEKLAEIEKQRQWDYEHNQNYIVTGKCENGWYQRQ